MKFNAFRTFLCALLLFAVRAEAALLKDLTMVGALNELASGATLTINGTLVLGTGSITLQNAVADGTTKGVAAFTAAEFNSSSGVISLDYTNAQAASGSLKGFLTAADWTTFNGKENVLTFNLPLSRATNAVSIANAAADGTTKGAATFLAADFDASSGLISIDYANAQAATGSLKGFLTAADWTTFNAKMTNPMTTAGDLIVGGSSGTPARLGIGTALWVLRVNAGGTALEWAASAAGAGTVTHTGGALTSNALVLGAGTDDVKVVAGFTTDGTSILTLGVAGSSVGGLAFKNATSGTVTFQPTTGALGTVTLTLPATSGTLFHSGTVADLLDAPFFAADAGANDTYTATLSPAPSAYGTGVHYRFKANTANTGAASINFNSIGAKTIVKAAGGITTALSDNDIRAGQWVDLVYDGTNMQMQSTLGNAGGGGSGTVASSSTGQFAVYTAATTVTGSSIFTISGDTVTLTAASASANLTLKSVTANNTYLQFFIGGTERATLAAVGATNSVVTGTAVNDFALYTAGSNALWLVPNQSSNSEWWKFSSAGVLTTKTGTLSLGANPSVTSTASATHTLNSASANDAYFFFKINGTERAVLATVGVTNSIMTGTAVNDLAFYTSGANAIWLIPNQGSNSEWWKLSSTGVLSTKTGTATFAGSITTGAPSGGTAAAWKFGTVASVTPTAQNRTIELDVAGTRYFVTAKTTND